MNKKAFFPVLFTLGSVCTILFFPSCNTGKNIKQLVYLNNVPDSSYKKIIASGEARIQPGDRISIVVGALNTASALPYNMPAVATGSKVGYLVESDGTIELPQLGKMYVANFTRKSLSDSLTKILKKFLSEPLVIVQFVNFRITVLGDVAHPGVLEIPDGKVSIIEAIGLAGDLQISGKRENILIIREKGDERDFGRVDMTSTNVFKSPFYYLQQNDVVYVEMNKTKIAASDQTLIRNLTIASTIISVLTTLGFLLINLKN